MRPFSQSFGQWLFAILLSVLIHGLVAEYLRWGTEPDPIVRRENRRVIRDISSVEVPTDRVRQKALDASGAPLRDAQGERHSLQPIASVRAKSLAPPAAPIAALPSIGQRQAAGRPQGDAIIPAAGVGKGVALSALQPSSQAVSVEIPETDALAPSSMTSVALADADTKSLSQRLPLSPAPTEQATAALPVVGDTVRPAPGEPLMLQPRAGVGARLISAPDGATKLGAIGTVRLASPVRLAKLAPSPARVFKVEVSVTPAAKAASLAQRLSSEAMPTAGVKQAQVPQAEKVQPSKANTTAMRLGSDTKIRIGRVAARPTAIASIGVLRIAAPLIARRAAPAPVVRIEPKGRKAAQPKAAKTPLRPTAPAATSASEISLVGVISKLPALEKQAVSAPISARLAWSGTVNAGLDQKSLATIQSLMRAGSVSQSQSYSGSAKDRIVASLAYFECSRLQAVFQPETGGLEIRGHVPDYELKPKVVSILQEAVGSSIPVGDNLLVLPRPLCSVLAAVERLGVPQSTDQKDDPLVMGQQAQAQILSFEEDQQISFVLQAPEFDGYIYFDYFDSNGNVLHILPSAAFSDNYRKSGTTFEVGAVGSNDAAFVLRAAPPFGQDIAVVLATSHALYDGFRPPIEKADTYLDWLAGRLDQHRKEQAHFQGEWVYLFVRTGARGSFLSRAGDRSRLDVD